jgi:glycosyltransferase involved in cell wall biosynthesis
MKILMIAPQPFFSPRGTPLSVYYRTRVLADLGHEVDLLTYPIGKDVLVQNVNIVRSPRVPLIKEVRIGPSFPKLLLDTSIFVKALHLLMTKRYDMLHVHEEAAFFALIFRALFKIHFIYDMHSSLPQQLENFNYSRFKPLVRLFEILERRVLSESIAIITICDDLQDLVNRYGFVEKSELIKNTLFEPLIFREDIGGEIQLTHMVKPKNRSIILYTGTFEPYQGIEMCIGSIKRAVRDRQDILFVLVGGNAHQTKRMKSLAKELNVEDYVVFTGTLDVNTAKKFISEADVLLSPRLKGTNTPLKIYEYMASGVPIVATNLWTHKQELDESCAFLCEPESDAFAEAILQCLSNSSEAKRRSENAVRRYREKYGEEKYKEKMEIVIERARIGNHRLARRAF